MEVGSMLYTHTRAMSRLNVLPSRFCSGPVTPAAIVSRGRVNGASGLQNLEKKDCWCNLQSKFISTAVWLQSHRNPFKVSPPLFGQNRCFSGITQAALHIELVPCLKDNYAYLLHDTQSGVTGVVDPSESAPIVDVLKRSGLILTYILNTHHHWDHTGGNLSLRSMYNAKVVGPYVDKDRIPGIDITLHDKDVWMFGTQKMQVLETPGHTRGHVCFYFPESKTVFTGDTLFSLTCGKLFEGSPEEMLTSLSKIASLPDDTKIYCGHEYTLSSAKFAMAMEPSNAELCSYFEKVKELRKNGLPTIPSSLGKEKLCNPFLRLSSPEVRNSLGIPGNASDQQVLAALRGAKDRF